MKQIFQVPGYLTGMTTKASSIKLTYEIDKTIDPEQITMFFNLQDKPSYMTVSSHTVEAEDIIDLPPLRPVEDNDKPPSQRLRAALYVMWNQNNDGFKTADEHYKYYLEKFISHVKGKLDE